MQHVTKIIKTTCNYNAQTSSSHRLINHAAAVITITPTLRLRRSGDQ